MASSVDSAARSQGWELKPVAVRGLSERIAVTGPIVLGRATTNQVVLPEGDYPHVSAHHARLVVDGAGKLHVEDLASRNGTFVNDARVQRAQLRPGDLLRLGDEGPRFVVEQPGQQTGPVTASSSRPAALSLTQTTIVRVKRALGVPEDEDIGGLVAGSEQRLRRRLRIAAAAGVLCIAGAWIVLRSLQRDEIDQLAALNHELERRLLSNTSSFEHQAVEWEQQRQRLQEERALLQRRIAQFDEQELGARAELDRLREELRGTNERLQSYDPEVVESLRLSEVQRVRGAVVFIETTLRLRSSKSGKLLRLRGRSMTFDGDGEVFERESSGSGFCIGPDGLIVSNGHVVHPEGSDGRIEIGPDEFLEPELEHAVVFSGSDVRHPVRHVKVLGTGDEDLALLRIEPFPDMPFIADFDPAQEIPADGAQVYVHGFPLGMQAIQDGQRLIASSFRGSLSRRVSNWLQVDAAVHPGNSGGPLTNAAGKVIGVVTRVQRINGDAIAPDMGYAIPVAAVARLLPAKAAAPVAAEAATTADKAEPASK